MPLPVRLIQRLKMRDLHLFEAVVRAKTMGRAAGQLHLTQPAVSKAIGELEEMLGVRLLDRSRGGVEPTPYGLSLLRSSAAIFDELRHGVQEIEFLSDSAAGELRIGAIGPVIGGVLPVALANLNRQYPRLVFHVSMTGTTRDLRERNIDLLLGRVSAGAKEDDLTSEVLFEEPMVVAVGVDHALAKRRKVALADLVDQPWTLPRHDTAVGSFIQDLFATIGHRQPPATVICNALEMQRELLISGQFVGLLPRSVFRFGSHSEHLRMLPVRMPVDLSKRLSPIGVLSLKRRSHGPVAQLFLKTIREVARRKN